MCSLEEGDEAYQFLGFPGYNPHVKAETFQKYYLERQNKVHGAGASDCDKMLLINSQRIFNIAAGGKTWQEREDLARTYFDMVRAVEIGMQPENYSTTQGESKVLMQVYLVNESRGIYAFRPITRYGYLYHRLLKVGYLVGEFRDLKKRIDWTYVPQNLEKDRLRFLCSPGYYRRQCRTSLKSQTGLLPRKFLRDSNWYYWPDLD